VSRSSTAEILAGVAEEMRVPEEAVAEVDAFSPRRPRSTTAAVASARPVAPTTQIHLCSR
jgi:hypothetical protein